MKKLLFSSLLVAALASSAFSAFPGSGGIVIRPATSSSSNYSSSKNTSSGNVSVSAPSLFNSVIYQYLTYTCRYYGHKRHLGCCKQQCII